jgi:hypothetical protein
VYDTGKIVNILVQLDGGTVRHVDPDRPMHIGGMSRFLSPPDAAASCEIETPSWAAYHGMEARLAVTWYTAELPMSLLEATPCPDLPPGIDAATELLLFVIRDEIVDLVYRYRAGAQPVGAPT